MTASMKSSSGRLEECFEEVATATMSAGQPPQHDTLDAVISSVSADEDQTDGKRITQNRMGSIVSVSAEQAYPQGYRRNSLQFILSRLSHMSPASVSIRAVGHPSKVAGFNVALLPSIGLLILVIARSTEEEKNLLEPGGLSDRRQWVIAVSIVDCFVAAVCLAISFMHTEKASGSHQALVVAQIHSTALMLVISSLTLGPSSDTCTRCRDLAIGIVSLLLTTLHIVVSVLQILMICNDTEIVSLSSTSLTCACACWVHASASLTFRLSPIITGA